MNLTELLNENKQLKSYKRGPQFKAKGGIIAAFVAVSLLALTVYLYIIEYYQYFIFPMPFSLIVFSYALDFRGVQIDYKSKMIREYRIFLNNKKGKWYPLQGFTELHLKKDYAIDKTGLENVSGVAIDRSK